MIKKSLHELSALLEKKETNSREIASSFVARIDELNPKLNAFITVDRERVFAEAAESDARRASGKALSKFDGIPVALKDNICTEGLRTTCGSGILRDFTPPYSASSYIRLREKGFITLGKTNMDEFAMGSSTETSFFGPAKNPYDISRVPGGSSGGSAAAVASMMAPAALGSDTGGSIRQPAAFCGVVGVRPTYGRVSRYGLMACVSSLDQIGPVSRSVDDAAALLAAISGHDYRDSTTACRGVDFASPVGDVRGLKAGVPEEYFVGVSTNVKEAVMRAVGELEKLGAKAVPLSLPLTEYGVAVYHLIAMAEASSNLGRCDGVRFGYRSPNAEKPGELYARSRGEGFGKEVKRRIILGTFFLGSGSYDAFYLKALKGRALIARELKEAFRKADVIITPAAAATAFALGEKMGNPLGMYVSEILTVSANLAALPCLSVPVGLDDSGLPMGLQVMADHFNERKMLDCAKAVESICGVPAPRL